MYLLYVEEMGGWRLLFATYVTAFFQIYFNFVINFWVDQKLLQAPTTWKVSKYGVISGPYLVEMANRTSNQCGNKLFVTFSHTNQHISKTFKVFL